MDHNGWDEWPADDHDLGDAETADRGDHDDLLDPHLGAHALGSEPDGADELWPHEGYPAPDEMVEPAEPRFGAVDAHVDEPLDHAPDYQTLGAGGDHAGPGVEEGYGAGAGGEAGFGPAGEAPPLSPDPVFGADPDAAGPDIDGWDGPEFPPPVDLGDLPDPVDGPPWSDASLLGGEPLAEPAGGGMPLPADLFGYAGLDVPGGDLWAALRAVEDPAASALARWWGPGS